MIQKVERGQERGFWQALPMHEANQGLRGRAFLPSFNEDSAYIFSE